MLDTFYVYMLPTSDGRLIKVGYSTNPMKRLAALSRDYKFDPTRGVVLSSPTQLSARRIETSILNTLDHYAKPQLGMSGTEFLDSLSEVLVLELLQTYDRIPGHTLDFRYFYNTTGMVSTASELDRQMYLVGNRLRSARLGKQLTREALSVASGVADSTIKRIEAGGNFTFRAMLMILDVLKIDELKHLMKNVEPVERLRGRRA